ncbi:hypothetical protein FB451DRAFT_186608 [Mycena latifolia]|nr:hypothetical protein FB451DRAFT_186608 [Mycena latifolia]
MEAILETKQGGPDGPMPEKGFPGDDGHGSELTMSQLAGLLAKGDVHGGRGRNGGQGEKEGGTGGAGCANKLASPIWSGGNTDGLSVLTVAQFCEDNQLNGEICTLLEGCGFRTSEDLFKALDGDLEKAGFKLGHIAELKRALRQFVVKHTGM